MDKLPSAVLRTHQRIPLPWSKNSAAKRLLERNEWLVSTKSRIPRHYVEFYKQWEKGPQLHIHDRPVGSRFEKDEFGNVRRVQVARVPVLYPDEFHKGLWGGEGVVKGGLEPPEPKHKPQYKPAREMYWHPRLHFGVVYSEILDKHLQVVMTERAQRLIDESFGLDNYLLDTPVNEIYSHLGLKLKRELLLALANPDELVAPDDPGKRREILDRHADHIVPFDVADWHGLPLLEAIEKQESIDEENEVDAIRPMKQQYRRELLETLRSGHFDDIDPSLMFDAEQADPGIVKMAVSSIKKSWKS